MNGGIKLNQSLIVLLSVIYSDKVRKNGENYHEHWRIFKVKKLEGGE